MDDLIADLNLHTLNVWQRLYDMDPVQASARTRLSGATLAEISSLQWDELQAFARTPGVLSIESESELRRQLLRRKESTRGVVRTAALDAYVRSMIAVDGALPAVEG